MQKKKTGKDMPESELQIIQAEEDVEDYIDEDEEISNSIRYTIGSYGADMTVEGLVNRLNRKDIFIPKFQRKFVWTKVQASRFVESLILGLPVPGIFVYKENMTKKLMVVDGQQRLCSLQFFYDRIFDDKEFSLIGVSKELQGKTYKTLAPEDKRSLNDAVIHTTICQQINPDDNGSSVYSLFERLNTGGTSLSQQEIRACVYRGALNDFLSEMAQNTHWRKLYAAKNPRKKDEEIILRFFALYYQSSEYERPMKEFLNTFMDFHRDIDSVKQKKFRDIFERTVEVVAEVLPPKALRPKRALNVSVADAVFVGLARRLEKGTIIDHDALRSAHKRLLDKLSLEELYTVGTTNKDRVDKRIEYASKAYETIS